MIVIVDNKYVTYAFRFNKENQKRNIEKLAIKVDIIIEKYDYNKRLKEIIK